MSKRLDAIATLVQKSAPGMSPEAFGLFMIIAREDSMSLHLLADELNLSQARVMRYVAELSAWEFEGQRGAGLVRIREKKPGKKEILLSSNGLKLKENIKRVIDRQH